MVVPRRRGIILGGALLLVVTILLLVTQGDQQDKDKAGGRKGPQRSKKHPNQEEYLDRRGIRVIVGHYKGDEGPGPNLTQQELDANNFKPEVIVLNPASSVTFYFSVTTLLLLRLGLEREDYQSACLLIKQSWQRGSSTSTSSTSWPRTR